MKKNISLIIAGICIGVVGVYVYWFYNLSKTVIQINQRTTAIENFLNQQIQASQQALVK